MQNWSPRLTTLDKVSTDTLVRTLDLISNWFEDWSTNESFAAQELIKEYNRVEEELIKRDYYSKRLSE